MEIESANTWNLENSLLKCYGYVERTSEEILARNIPPWSPREKRGRGKNAVEEKYLKEREREDRKLWELKTPNTSRRMSKRGRSTI